MSKSHFKELGYPWKTILICALSVMLCACGTVTQLLGKLHNGNSYPAAPAKNQKIVDKPPHVNINAYHSVQTSPLRPWQRDDVAIAVAISGGGYRAANLGAGVLLGLESVKVPGIKSNLLQEVDYFSTVSGGGLAVGLYMANAHKHVLAHGLRQPFNLTQVWGELAPKLRINYSNNLIFGYRRSLILEQKIGENLLTVDDNGRELVLGDIFIAKSEKHRHPHLPMWISNATIIQNMLLFPFTPDILSAYSVSRYIHNKKVIRLKNTDQPLYGFEMPVATAVMASASFPYFVAGTTLWSKGCKEKKCYLQLFDGGLVDNLGLFTAIEMLQQDKAKNKVLIIVDAFYGDRQPFSKIRRSPRKFDLLDKILNATVDAFQRSMQIYAPMVAKASICATGADQVLVVYLDLFKHPEVSHVPTSLWLTEAEQEMLISVAKTVVAENTSLTRDLPKLLRGENIAKCINTQ